MSRRSSSLGGSLKGATRRSREGSASFLLQKDLEMAEEFQKIQLAGFLRELHQVAVEKSTHDFLDELSGHSDHSRVMIKEVNTIPENEPVESKKETDSKEYLSLSNITKQAETPAQGLQKSIDAVINLQSASSSTGPVDPKEFSQLMTDARAIFEQEDTVVIATKATETTVVGDIHGSLPCLQCVLELAQVKTLPEEPHRQVVFIGDFVDRGQHSLPVLTTLLLLKVAYPTQVYLVRGNHEDTMTASTYGFRDEMDETYDYETADDLWYHVGKLFAALPLVIQTKQACLMHGGLPQEDFNLTKFNQAIETDLRTQLKTVADPYDEEEGLVQALLWSDPAPDGEFGLVENERGAGYTFGADISEQFLESHNLRYIIRAHEPFEEGYHVHHEFDMKQGAGKGGVITVFSTANYPDGEGTNKGAVLKLNEETGEFKPLSFRHNDESSTPNYAVGLANILQSRRTKLISAFQEIQQQNNEIDVKEEEETKDEATTLITVNEWIEVMSMILDLPDVPWEDIQPELAPADDAHKIDWNDFMTRLAPPPKKDVEALTDGLEPEEVDLLHEHHDKFLEIFQLLDLDDSGSLSEKEFVSGIKMLNEQISSGSFEPSEEFEKEEAMSKDDKDHKKSRKSHRGSSRMSLKDPHDLFKKYDADGDGELSIAEFCKATKKSATLKKLAKKLDLSQLDSLHENHEMLIMAFKFLDTDKSGDISWKEFEIGVTLLNKRLGKNGGFLVRDPKELFGLLDSDGSGSIDIVEFHKLFQSM